jgi:hypothetical protein
MSEVSTLDAVVQATQAAAVAAVTAEDAADEVSAEDDAAPDPDERQLNALLRKAESAFCKGQKAVVLTRVECGRWCHEIFALRLSQRHKDRKFSNTLIFNRLAVHADSKRECDGSELAEMFQVVELLSPNGALAWLATQRKLDRMNMTIGKLLAMRTLIDRVEGTETYGIFNMAKAEQAKALFVWAHGDGLDKPSTEEVRNRVLELRDPAAYAVKAEEKAQKAADAQADSEQTSSADDDDADEEPEKPDNLISTDAESKPNMPNWKDVGEGMAALAQEAAKQAPGRIGDVMMDFAKRLPWTSAMVKGLVAGIAEMKDAEKAQEALQELVNAIGDDYGIFADSEIKDAA